MIFADTSFFAAAARINDEHHARASEIALGIKERVITTDHVFSELVTFLSNKEGNKFAFEYALRFLQSEVTVIHADQKDLISAIKHIRQYNKLSMCDAISAVVMQNLGIMKILSFDSDFDRLGLERIG